MEPKTKRKARATTRRIALLSADQVLSSLTNIALSVVVAREVGRSAFGAFAAATMAYIIALGLTRALCCEPLLIRYSAAPAAERARATRAVTGCALACGLVGAAVCGAIAFFGPRSITLAFSALALSLPGLLVQDTWRFALFTNGRPGSALMNDATWAVVQAAGLAYLFTRPHPSVFEYVLSWGIAGSVGAVLGALQTRWIPDVRSAWGWVREHRALSMSLAADFGMLIGAGFVSVYSIALTSGLAALGAYRGAEVLLGPVNTAITAGRVIALSELVGARRRGPRRSAGVAIAFSAGLAVLGVLWLLGILWLPNRSGVAVLGANWQSARAIVVFVALSFIAIGSNVGPLAGLRALEAGRRLVRSRIVASIAILAAGVSGSVLNGARGAAIGIAGANLASALLWWWTYGSLLRHTSKPPDDGSDVTDGEGHVTDLPPAAASIWA